MKIKNLFGKKYINPKSGIYNEQYLEKKYSTYLSTHPNSYFIMIDLKEFKLLNDSLGHIVGDICIKEFGQILKSCFNDSLTFHFHGDEYAVLTSLDEEEIEKTLKECNDKINVLVQEGIVPANLRFNAGSTKAEYDYEETYRKADCMMYYAKQNNITYKRYNSGIYQDVLAQKEYENTIEKAIKHQQFSYTGRKLFLPEQKETNIMQIYTKKLDGNSIFDNGRYNSLKSTFKLVKFDNYNVKKLLKDLVLPCQNIILSIDSKSLLTNDTLLRTLINLQNKAAISYSNVILSINLSDMSDLNHSKLISKIYELKQLGFQICLDKYDSTIGDNIWENSDVNYVKFTNQYWKNAMEQERFKKILQYRLAMFHDCQITPMFDYVESLEEDEFLNSLSDNEILLSGNYYSDEVKLSLRR